MSPNRGVPKWGEASYRSWDPDQGLRVSDADRGEVADELSRHYAEGRLDDAEFKERMDLAMAARTRGELSGLFFDLPQDDIRTTGHGRRRPIALLVLLILVVVAATASLAWVPRVPWLILAVVAFLVLRHERSRHHGGPSRLGRSSSR